MGIHVGGACEASEAREGERESESAPMPAAAGCGLMLRAMVAGSAACASVVPALSAASAGAMAGTSMSAARSAAVLRAMGALTGAPEPAPRPLPAPAAAAAAGSAAGIAAAPCGPASRTIASLAAAAPVDVMAFLAAGPSSSAPGTPLAGFDAVAAPAHDLTGEQPLPERVAAVSRTGGRAAGRRVRRRGCSIGGDRAVQSQVRAQRIAETGFSGIIGRRGWIRGCRIRLCRRRCGRGRRLRRGGSLRRRSVRGRG